MAEMSGCGELARMSILVRASSTSMKISLVLLAVVASPDTGLRVTRYLWAPAWDASRVISLVRKKSFLLMEMGWDWMGVAFPAGSIFATVRVVLAPVQLLAATSICILNLSLR